MIKAFTRDTVGDARHSDRRGLRGTKLPVRLITRASQGIRADTAAFAFEERLFGSLHAVKGGEREAYGAEESTALPLLVFRGPLSTSALIRH